MPRTREVLRLHSRGALGRQSGVPASWETLRQQLSTHQVVTVILPASNGETLKIRKGSAPEETHRQIYDTPGFPHEAMKPVRTW